MPVVHSSASVLSTEGVLTGQGPSSKVSTTSWSRRKSSCLKCSKPKPGPPVVSISTTRVTPSALGLLQVEFDAAALARGAKGLSAAVANAEAPGDVDGSVDAELGLTPVTPTSGCATFAGKVVSTGCGTERVRPTVKPTTPAARATAPAAIKTIALRMHVPVSEFGS